MTLYQCPECSATTAEIERLQKLVSDYEEDAMSDDKIVGSTVELGLLPCPFCGGAADQDGWIDGNGRTGPECEKCGATARSTDDWNKRFRERIGVHDVEEFYKDET